MNPTKEHIPNADTDSTLQMRLLAKARFIAALVILLTFTLFYFFDLWHFPFFWFALIPLAEMFLNQPYPFFLRLFKTQKHLFIVNQTIDILAITLGIHVAGLWHIQTTALVYPLVFIFSGIVGTPRLAYFMANFSFCIYITSSVLVATALMPTLTPQPRPEISSSYILGLVLILPFYNLITYYAVYLSEEIRQRDTRLRRANSIKNTNDRLQQELTERKKIEEALRTSEQRYSHITENIPGVVYQFILHPDGKFSMPYISAAVYDMVGLTADTIMKDPTTLFSLMPKTDFPTFVSRIHYSAHTLLPWRERLRFITHGEERWFDGRSRPERQPNGDVLWNGVIVDITQQFVAEKEQQRFADIIERTADLAACFNTQQKAFYINNAGRTMLQIPPDIAVEDISISSIHSPSHGKMIQSEALAYATAHGTWSQESTLITSSNTLIPVIEILSAHRNTEGDIDYFSIIAHDITNRKKAEQTLRENDDRLTLANMTLLANERALKNIIYDLDTMHEDLKSTQLKLIQSEKLASIGQLSAGIAHEINNPIGFIGSNLQVLETYAATMVTIIEQLRSLPETIATTDTEHIHRVLQKLMEIRNNTDITTIQNDIMSLIHESEEGIERIRKIILDLRTFARTDTDAMRDIHVEEIIDGILNIVANEIKYKVDIKKIYASASAVRCNPQRIGQIFMNLLINAAQAIEKNGVITIETIEEGPTIFVKITDTGSGIPPENRAKIFDPFFTTKPAGTGTGLGLSISYEIAKKHGGDITVQSTLGKGTTFTVSLPAYKPDMHIPEGPYEQGNQSSRR